MRGSVVGVAGVMAVAIVGMSALAWTALSGGGKSKQVKVTSTRDHGAASRSDGPHSGRAPVATVDEPAEAPKAPRPGVGALESDSARDPARQPGALGASGEPGAPNRPAGAATGVPGSGADPFDLAPFVPGPPRPGAAAAGPGGPPGGAFGGLPVRQGGGACPAGMVDVGAYCIDATEVTNNNYKAFLDAKPNRRLQPATCSWNLDYTPKYGGPTADNRPVVGVDWCDAWLYCAWSGKRLCGGIGGGPVSPGAFADASRNEWFNVCTNGGQTAFSYGDTFDESKCAHSADDGALAPVGSFPTCVGNTSPYDAVFDMSGNAWEWEDSCSGAAGEKDLCRVRGGGTHASSAVVSCSMDYLAKREDTFRTVGIRCCAGGAGGTRR